MKLFERVYQCPHCKVWHSSKKKALLCHGIERPDPIVTGYECTLCKTISLTIKHDCKGGR